KVPFPIIILSAGLIGFIGGKLWRDKFLVIRGHAPADSADPSVLGDETESPEHTRPSFARAIQIVVIGLTLWFLPTIMVGAWLGWESVLFKEGVFFSKAAVVTFGGAYAVLPYVAQQAVDHFGWLQPGQMMDGLGLAETTPGPLIMVTQFVGFMGGWTQHGNMNPLLAATLGALLTTWATFTPCFIWILVGGPYIERLRGNESLTTALSAVTAAVVGVVMNLAVWFGLHVLWPANGTFDWFALAIGAIAFIGMMKWNWGVIAVVVGSGVVGLLHGTLLSLR
ncbi:MAG: chromate transporter, partial [Chthoniobacterales bacterium]